MPTRSSGRRQSETRPDAASVQVLHGQRSGTACMDGKLAARHKRLALLGANDAGASLNRWCRVLGSLVSAPITAITARGISLAELRDSAVLAARQRVNQAGPRDEPRANGVTPPRFGKPPVAVTAFLLSPHHGRITTRSAMRIINYSSSHWQYPDVGYVGL